MKTNVIEKQDLQDFEKVEQSILEATREFEAKLRAIQPDLLIHISLSGLETPKPGCAYFMNNDGIARISIYDKHHLPF